MKNRMIWVVFVLLCVGRLCAADEASHRKAVGELFNQIDMAATVNQTAMQVAAALTGAAPEDEGYRDVVREYVRKYVSWDALKDEITALYMKTFTEQDINDLIAFYNTAVGRKLLAQSPAIAQDVAASVHRRLVEHSPELKKMMMDADLKAFQAGVDEDQNAPAETP